jgi:hypothetical protein
VCGCGGGTGGSLRVITECKSVFVYRVYCEGITERLCLGFRGTERVIAESVCVFGVHGYCESFYSVSVFGGTGSSVVLITIHECV